MKYLVCLLFAFTVKVSAECHGFYKVDKAAKEASVDYVELEKGVPARYCLDIPKDVKGVFLESTSINLGNASCSSVKLVAISPSKKKYKSLGTQPGIVGPLEGGRWIMRFTLKDGCNKYKFLAKWY